MASCGGVEGGSGEGSGDGGGGEDGGEGGGTAAAAAATAAVKWRWCHEQKRELGHGATKYGGSYGGC